MVLFIYFRPKKFGFKSFKKAWCMFKDTHIAFYKTKEESNGTPALKINTKGR